MDSFSQDGLTFEVRDSAPVGAESGDPVVLLHGFPQTSLAWSSVTERLVAAGRRVLAPDLRGYSPGARPQERSAYRLDVLTGDVLGLLDAAGLERVHLVGHDWGGGLAWDVAIRRPERVSRLTVLSTPHPAAMTWAIRHATQGLKSWYMGVFQVPGLAEAVMGRALPIVGLRGLGLPREHERAYVERLQEPGALTGALNWYRGMTQPRPAGVEPARGPVTVPTTYVWGRRDAYLGRAAAERTELFVDAPYRFVELDADHWLPEKRPDDVAEAILEPMPGADEGGPDDAAGEARAGGSHPGAGA